MGGSRVGTGGSDPPEKSQKIGFFVAILDRSLPSQHSMLGRHRQTLGKLFKWHFV